MPTRRGDKEGGGEISVTRHPILSVIDNGGPGGPDAPVREEVAAVLHGRRRRAPFLPMSFEPANPPPPPPKHTKWR